MVLPRPPLSSSRLSGFFGQRLFSTAAVNAAFPSDSDFTHVVIGGGVVGLAVARQLSLRDGTTTALLERHSAVGTETSARNSEVIHAGIYYPPDSLKTELCIRGRRLIYQLCADRGIAHRKTGKWIVAQTAEQRDRLHSLYDKCRRSRLDVPLRWVGAQEARREEPAVKALDDHGVLESSETGIIDTHGLMACLVGLFEEAGGTVALQTDVLGVEARDRGLGGWVMRVRSGASSSSSSSSKEQGTVSTVTADVVVNAAGLGAVAVHNMLVSDVAARRPMYYAKGSYFSYPAAHPRVNRLIYPVSPPGHAGLGTHLTLDLSGRMRFGPDVQWVGSPHDLDASAARLEPAIAEIRAYLDGVDAAALTPDYAGIRPKLHRNSAVSGAKGQHAFQDFVIEKRHGCEGWVDLLGIESPGLTSSLAIAEMVYGLLYGTTR